MSKISKTMKAELIAEHFAEQGKRLTNLKKVDVAKLDELILKHNIDIERLQKKRADIAVVEKEAKIQREKEYAEKQRIYMEECKAKEEERLRLWNSITEAQQMIICEKLAVHRNEEQQKKYNDCIAHTDRMERNAIAAGSRVVREEPTVVRINGVCVYNGSRFTPQTKEEWFSNMPQAFVKTDKESYEFVLPDIEQMIADDLVCECCGESDDSVGLATGENGVEMRVCRFCDVDGSNYNGWGDNEEEEPEPAVAETKTTYTICASETNDADYHDFFYCYGDLKQAMNAFNAQKKKKASKKYLYKKLKLQDDKTEKEVKVWQRTKEEIVRPTFQLAELNTFNYDYTLFKHERGGFCKYAVYNNTANHYVACDFDGDKIIGWGKGTIYKTLNAWTTANWKEQRIKDGNNKTTRNNAYRETKYIPLQLIDLEEMEYGPLYEEVDWQSSMTIEKK